MLSPNEGLMRQTLEFRVEGAAQRLSGHSRHSPVPLPMRQGAENPGGMVGWGVSALQPWQGCHALLGKGVFFWLSLWVTGAPHRPQAPSETGSP